jgi:acyl-CoA hydrolase/GNAT superfamily N-acetyltransferase
MKELQSSDWKNLIPPGSRVFIGSGAACPHALVSQMLENSRDLKDIQLVHIRTEGTPRWIAPEFGDTFTVNSLFAGPGVSEAINASLADYTPCSSSEIPKLFSDRILPIDVALVMATPIDETGFCSFGTNVDVISAACQAADTVIVQINASLPRTLGQSFIHKDKINAILVADEPIPEQIPSERTSETDRIGSYVAELIEDESTLQLETGPIPSAILRALENHRHLGIHSSIIDDSIMQSIQDGIIDNSRKAIHKGKTITASCLGSRRLYDFVHENPHVQFHPTEYVNSPLTIARNPKMVAVNRAIEVDLSGQVVSDSLGYHFDGGIGGQVDFIRGAAMSPGGKPIIAIPSTRDNGAISRIVPHLTEGSGVVTSRGDVHYVITEYGIATLRGRSIRERTLELIQIAHPKFRDQLLRAAYEHKWVPSYQLAWPRRVDEIGELEVRSITLKGSRYQLRPIHPSDERRLQEFFYSHSQETIQMRYGYTVDHMTRQRAYDLVNIDQSKDLALGIFEVQGPRETIHAVGRYYLDKGEKSAEVAFVVRESKRRTGMASVLLNSIAEIAQIRKIDYLWGRVRKGNLPMLALFRQHGGHKTPSDSVSDVDVHIPLPLEKVAQTKKTKKRKA